jgi:DedD protein
MKFVMNERIKHRLTGLVVIISIAVIFLPAMMKKSNQRFEENMHVSLKLPAKPVPPKVAIPNQQTMFKSVKVAHVDVPKVTKEAHPSQIAKAEPLSIKATRATELAKISQETKPVEVVKPVSIAKSAEPVKPTSAHVNAASKVAFKNNRAGKKETYAIQLASFSQQSNAESLVSRLRSKGYVASYNKSSGKQGEFYKVLVRQLNQREAALSLQKKLAENMQLNGFIIKEHA